MQLRDFLAAIDGHICGGAAHQWECYPNGQFIDVSNIDGEEVGSCVFDRDSQLVYEINMYVYEDNVAYRWIAPGFVEAYKNEAADLGVPFPNAYDDILFIDIQGNDDCDSEAEILNLVDKIVHKTYVHSKQVVDESVDGFSIDEFNSEVSADSVWPFLEGMSSDKEEDFEDLIDDLERLTAAENEYKVILTVKHVLSVKAGSMEEAIAKAKQFNKKFVNHDWAEGIYWEDSYVSKEAVSRRLENTSIEE